MSGHESKANSRSRVRVLLPYPRSSLGGIERFTSAVIRELADLSERVVWVLADEFRHLEKLVPQHENLVVEPFEWSHGSWQGISAKTSDWWRSVVGAGMDRESGRAEKMQSINLRIDHLIKKHGITHCLFTSPLDLPAPRLQVPVIAMFHDWSWRKFPENFYYTTPAHLNSLAGDWMETASNIIVPSHKVKEEACQFFPDYSDKITVIPYASDPDRVERYDPGQEDRPMESLPLFYYPGSALAYKGHLSLFKAAHQLASTGHRFKVVLTGYNTRFLTGNEPAAVPQVEQCRSYYKEHKDSLGEVIESLDYCDTDKVEEFYRRSRRVVLPSVYEGFGLPLIESIARGCRVICSDIEPYREQVELYRCSDFVETYPVDDIQALSALIEQAIDQADSHKIPPAQAAAIAHRWTWKDTARDLMAVMQGAAD